MTRQWWVSVSLGEDVRCRPRSPAGRHGQVRKERVACGAPRATLTPCSLAPWKRWDRQKPARRNSYRNRNTVFFSRQSPCFSRRWSVGSTSWEKAQARNDRPDRDAALGPLSLAFGCGRLKKFRRKFCGVELDSSSSHHHRFQKELQQVLLCQLLCLLTLLLQCCGRASEGSLSDSSESTAVLRNLAASSFPSQHRDS